MRVVIIGAGNVGTNMARALLEKGIELVQIVDKNRASAQELANLCGTSYVDNLSEISRQADVYLLCVNDDAIEKIASVLRLPQKTVAHMSGSVPMDVLQNISSRIGVLYFLQTFSREVKVSLDHVPLFLECSAQAGEELSSLAKKLSSELNFVNSAQRAAVHLAAVVACNFTNILYTLSQEWLQKQGFHFSILHPLIGQTVSKAVNYSPALVQTGPAARGDWKTIERHREMLKEDPRFYEIYTLLSKEISERSHDKL